VPSVRAAVRRWVCQVVGMLLGFGAVGVAMVVTGGPGLAASNVGDRGHAQGADDASVQRIDSLVARHHCWRSAAPRGAGIPGHAVVALPGHQARLTASDLGFDIWLHGREGTLYAFCP
jgi:hypothetical protein